MPRGYVHQARSLNDNLSFHITIALATHDWSLAGLLSSASQQIWTSVIDFRKALPREFGTVTSADQIPKESRQSVEAQLDRAMAMLRSEVTCDTIHNAMTRKYQSHNQEVAAVRSHVIEKQTQTEQSTATRPLVTSGPEASDFVTLTSKLRLATPDEKADVRSKLPQSGGPPGLHVREDNYPAITTLIQHFQKDPSAVYAVCDLASVWETCQKRATDPPTTSYLCDLTLLCFAKQCVALGTLAVVDY